MFDILTGLSETNWFHFIASIVTTYALIFAAEIGDKSQLVCMTLASRHRPLPVCIGASLAFIGLNILAVLFGSTITSVVPALALSLCITLLFFGFGIHALWFSKEEEDETGAILIKKAGTSILFSTFMLITLAELGDKTQIAIVALSSTQPPLPVWIGATLALISTSALGVWIGATLLKRMPIQWLHRISGLIFLGLAILAGYNSLMLWQS